MERRGGSRAADHGKARTDPSRREARGVQEVVRAGDEADGAPFVEKQQGVAEGERRRPRAGLIEQQDERVGHTSGTTAVIARSEALCAGQ